jgi:hypothetical protein
METEKYSNLSLLPLFSFLSLERRKVQLENLKSELKTELKTEIVNELMPVINGLNNEFRQEFHIRIKPELLRTMSEQIQDEMNRISRDILLWKLEKDIPANIIDNDWEKIEELVN